MSTFQVTDDVYGIDVGLFDEGFTAAYLFDDEEPTLVDAGIAATADQLLDDIAACGVDPTDLEHIVLSHIHLDHSGAAGDIVEAVPDVTVYIHELTASHLVDPGALVASSRQAMGEHFELMGEPVPVPESNIDTVSDAGMTLDIGSNRLELVYAPGHSPDHFAVWNPERDLLFAAECIGGYLERADRWTPPSTLPAFDVELIDAAIETLEAFEPETILFPHFGVWPHEPETAFEMAKTELYRFDEWIVERYEETGSRSDTKDAVAAELLDLSPPYDPTVESFYSSLLTDGYLKYHGLGPWQ